MSTLIRSNEAAALLNVSKPTLYAYVSRGRLQRTTAPDGRTSLFARDEVERLAVVVRAGGEQRSNRVGDDLAGRRRDLVQPAAADRPDVPRDGTWSGLSPWCSFPRIPPNDGIRIVIGMSTRPRVRIRIFATWSIVCSRAG